MSSKAISIGILIFIIISIIVYVVVMLMMASSQSGIFSPYNPPTPPADQNAYYPLGNVTALCQDEIYDRNIIICASYYGGFTGMTAGQIGLTGIAGLTGMTAGNPCNPANWPQSTSCPAPPIPQAPSNINPASAMFRQVMRTSYKG
jgi:hypothetical protein